MIQRPDDSFLLYLFAYLLLAVVILVVAQPREAGCVTDGECLRQCRVENPTWTHAQCDAHLFLVPVEE